jgi:Tfp pilus assembly protein PilE
MINKKAAMFGLDARIALAIFGALSVISGAALYSAIQNSKVVGLVAQISEINKAFEQYYLDTGVTPPKSTGIYYRLRINNLSENIDNISGWNGPYLQNKITTQFELYHYPYKSMQLFVRSKNDPWGGIDGVDTPLPQSCSGSSEPCVVWGALSGVPCNLAEKFDEFIDGDLDYKNGKSRVYDSSNISSTTLCTIYLDSNFIMNPSE